MHERKPRVVYTVGKCVHVSVEGIKMAIGA